MFGEKYFIAKVAAKIIETELTVKFSFKKFSTFQILGYKIAANRLELQMDFFLYY